MILLHKIMSHLEQFTLSFKVAHAFKWFKLLNASTVIYSAMLYGYHVRVGLRKEFFQIGLVHHNVLIISTETMEVGSQSDLDWHNFCDIAVAVLLHCCIEWNVGWLGWCHIIVLCLLYYLLNSAEQQEVSYKIGFLKHCEFIKGEMKVFVGVKLFGVSSCKTPSA